MQQKAAKPAISNSIFEEVKICFAKKEAQKEKGFWPSPSVVAALYNVSLL